MNDQTDCKYSVEGGALCFDGIYIQLASAGEMALASDIERLNARFKVLQAVFTGVDVGTSDGIGSRIIYTPEIQAAIWGVKR